METDEICELILACLPDTLSRPRDVVHLCSNRRRGSAISDDAFEMALLALRARGELAMSSNKVRRLEIDFEERKLQAALEPLLIKEEFYKVARLVRSKTIFHSTATGGSRDTGVYSRPDFTFATIREFRFDPHRHLDVITFELKNRKGATLAGVHEALAHTRFAHYAYFLCPRSEVTPSENDELQRACSAHGLGFVQFRLRRDSQRQPDVSELTLVLPALRQSPDPLEVERFLERRLPQDKLSDLERIARA